MYLKNRIKRRYKAPKRSSWFYQPEMYRYIAGVDSINPDLCKQITIASKCA